MHTTSSSLRRGACLICFGAAVALPALRTAAADAPATADTFPVWESYIKVSGVAPWMTGDRAAFAARTNMPNTGSGGIEDLFYTKDISEGTTIKVNGRALEGADDYLASMNIAKDSLGSVEVGYKRFRTFYDGVGGFFPLTDLFRKTSPESLHVDRSSFWIDTKLAKPNTPVFTLSFHDDIRTGQKDSSEWGATVNPNATVVAGALVGKALPVNTPYIAPNVLSLAEHHRTLEAGMVATIGKTTETLKATIDWVNNLDTRNYLRYPGSTVIADTPTIITDDQESVDSKSFRIINQVETPFNEHIALEVGLTYFHVSAANGGQWITPAYNATANAIFPTATAGNITANAKLDDYAGNIFLKFTPNKDWRAEAGFRAESNITSDAGGFIVTSLATGATSVTAANTTTANDVTYSHQTDHGATPEVSLQYLGINRLSLYANFSKRTNRGSQHWINPYAAVTTTGAGVVTTAPAPIGSVFFQDANQDYENAKLGANWNASSQVIIRAEVFRKDHQNRFIGANDIVGTKSYGALYATGYNFTGVTLSLNLKPTPELSFTTRYQPQFGTMSVTGNTVTGGDGSDVTSGKAKIQMISETVDWTPYRQLYLQGNVNVVYDYLQTTYPAVVVSTTTSIAVPFQNANNNYVTASALCGFVLDKLTDAQIQGIWQRADNYNPQTALGGQPYGASFELKSITAGLKHKFSDRLVGDGKIGYFDSTNGTTGGFTNYKGPLAYLALEYAL